MHKFIKKNYNTNILIFVTIVFVYGATGAGKTFTMLGNENNYGITYLTMKDLYTKVNEQKDSKKFEIYVSYLEVIYYIFI